MSESKEQVQQTKEVTTINQQEPPQKDPSSKKSNKKRIIIIIGTVLIVIVALVLLWFFMKKNNNKPKTINNDVKEVYSKYKMTGNELENFDLKFLQLETDNQNMVYSPLSIKYALEMLSAGAKGTSKAQIDALIGDYKAKKYINSKNMSFANAMFIRNTFKDSVKENYIQNIQSKYNAEIIYDAFENQNNINSWVSDKTFGLINQLVDDVTDKQFYLINALAIDMEWNKRIQATSENYQDTYSVSYAHEDYSDSIGPIEGDYYGAVKFNNNTLKSKAVEIGASINNYDIVNTLGKENIRQMISKEYQDWLASDSVCPGSNNNVEEFVDNFIKELDANYKKVDASTDFKFHDDSDVKAFAKELKEYNGTTLEYIAIMPKNVSLKEYISSSTATSLTTVINKLKSIELDNFEKGKVTKIIGGIPLFKYEYELKLKDDLKKLGVTDIFTSKKADLSGLTKSKNVFIDEVAHKANIEFSNEGIKAAAATQAGGAGSTSCGFEHLFEVPVVEIDLTLNNPYLYLIRDKNSKEVWFAGTVYHPIENSDEHTYIINEKNKQ